MTLNDLISLLSFLPQDERKDTALWIAEETTSLSRTEIIGGKDIENIPNLKNIIERLKNNEPLQYIFSRTYWRGLDLQLNAATLIPRIETAELVDFFVAEYQHRAISIPIIDIGTGSGCIAISLKKALPYVKVIAADISEQALSVAEQNAKNNGAKDIDFVKLDILREGSLISQPVIIISNPPYITLKEKEAMSPNVLDYEPHTALFVPDDDPLLFYRAMMNTRAVDLFFEINPLYVKELTEMFIDNGYQVIVRNDFCGKQRFLRAFI